METPLPLLNQDTEEGHITHEINHLKSNSKPTAPMDISLSMQLRRDSIEQQQLAPAASAANPLTMVSTTSGDLDPNAPASSAAPDARVREQIALLRGQLDKKIKALKDSVRGLEKKVAAVHNANVL